MYGSSQWRRGGSKLSTGGSVDEWMQIRITMMRILISTEVKSRILIHIRVNSWDPDPHLSDADPQPFSKLYKNQFHMVFVTCSILSLRTLDRIKTFYFDKLALQQRVENKRCRLTCEPLHISPKLL
jgi:hypothetical protein